MHIRLDDKVLLTLQTIGVLNRGAEFSGFGWCRIEGEEIFVYDFVLMDLGSEAWTEIPPEIILPLMEREDRANMKVWVHAHPVGNGKPGPHNWSGTDERTCTKEPMGGVPELVGWSVAIVRTPGGFVGRIDNHKTKKTLHLPVLPDLSSAYKAVDGVYARKRRERREKVVDYISSLFPDEDLELLSVGDRQDLEDWIIAEYGGTLEQIETQWWEGTWDEMEYDEFGRKTWTTRGTGIYSGRRI